MSDIVVAAFYHFAPLTDPAVLRAPLHALCRDARLCGTVLLAHEGINGTIAGPRAGIDRALAHIRALPGLKALAHTESIATEPPFGRMKTRLKREIVTMGAPGTDPAARTGHHVDAVDWNALISAPDVALIDTRNAYEVKIGSFNGAIDPGTKSFSEFPAWWQANRHRLNGKRIAMFCTGGVRCEKSTSYLMDQGVGEVFHLRGGILSYLEKVAPEDSLWHGGCFVFDRRISVGHGLIEGTHVMCHACRRPLVASDRARLGYEEGVSCHHCHDTYSAADRARFRERQKQVDLADRRGTRHLGG